LNVQELRTFLKRGLGMALATRDSRLHPDISDVTDVELSEDGKNVTVFLRKIDAEQALKNIEDNGRIAVSLARPMDYFAAQIKARVIKVRPVTPAEKERSELAGARYREEIRYIGVSLEAAVGYQMTADLAIEASVEDLFVQTPGPYAGRRMEKL
jgi:hypothetical protein